MASTGASRRRLSVAVGNSTATTSSDLTTTAAAPPRSHGTGSGGVGVNGGGGGSGVVVVAPGAASSSSRGRLGVAAPVGITTTPSSSIIPLPITPPREHSKSHLGPPQAPDTPRSLSNAQLADLYSHCIKLVTQDKVNQKNAWNLDLIDYMDAVIDRDQDNFQMASCTLDAGVKIYSARVDSTYTSAYKILGGLSTGKNQPGEDEEGGDKEEEPVDTEAITAKDKGPEDVVDAPNQNEEAATKPRSKKKEKASAYTSTIETNLESLNAKKLETIFEVDPLFRKTSAAFNLGGARGLLLNHIASRHGLELILDSADAVADSVELSFIDEPISVPEFITSGRALQKSLNNDICPTFKDLTVGSDTGKHLDDIDIADEKSNSPDQSPEEPPPPDDDDDRPGFFDAPSHAPQGDEAEEVNAPPPVDSIKALELVSDYHYFDPKCVQNWAGPDHWQFSKSAKRPAKPRSKGSEPTAKKRRTKKQQFLNFTDPSDFDPAVAFAPPGKTRTTLSEAALRKLSETDTTLPADCHYDTSMLSRLFTKPDWHFQVARKRIQNDELSTPAVDGNGLDEGDEGCADFGAEQQPLALKPDTDIMPPTNPDGVVDCAIPKSQQQGLQLIPKPKLPEHILLNYARYHKQVDVVALKESIWRILCDDPPTAPSSKGRHHSLKMAPGTSKSLHAVIERLQAYMPASALADVSVPFCFICVLHLSNEKSLQLHGSPDLSDLTISSC